MRVLYITDALAVWGGIERVLRDKMNYLARNYAYNVHVVTTDQGLHPIPYPLDDKVMTHDLDIRFHHQYRYRGIKRLIAYQKLQKLFKQRLKALIDELKPDVMVCIRVDFVSLVVAVKGDIPLVCESHSLCNAYRYENTTVWNRFRLRNEMRCLNKANCMVALTEGDANDWRQSCPRVTVIPNVVHLNDTGRYSDLKSKQVIFVGRMSAQKDFASMIEIWQQVNQRHPDWVLHAYGEGELKDGYERMLSEKNINMVLHAPTPDIFEKYMESSVFVLSSRFEPFGLVLPEAMSCGLPVVAFNCPYGPADIITHGVNGFLIENRDIRSFADKICLLIENESLRQEMGANASKSVAKFRAEEIMPQWDRLFKSIGEKLHTS